MCIYVFIYMYVYTYMFHNSSKENCKDQVYLFGNFQTSAPGLHVSPQMLQD